MAKQTTPSVLVSPDGGREWTPESPAEAVNLRARGWTVKPTDGGAGDSTEGSSASTSATKSSK